MTAAMPTTGQPADHSWMIRGVLDIPHTRHAVLISADGLVISCSEKLPRDSAERLGAAIGGIRSLSRQTIEESGSPWRRTLVESDEGYVVVCGGGANTVLAATASLEVDLPVLSLRMQKLVQSLGRHLGTGQRGSET